jgi:hypothetical protein
MLLIPNAVSILIVTYHNKREGRHGSVKLKAEG